MWLTLYGKTFQVQGIHRWTALIRGREVEESRPMAGIVLFVKIWKEIVLAYACEFNRVVIKLTIIYFENNIKFLLNVAKWIPVNGIGQCGTQEILTLASQLSVRAYVCNYLGLDVWIPINEIRQCGYRYIRYPWVFS